MTSADVVHEFLVATRDEPPTASMLFDMVRGMGWTIEAKPDGTASIRLKDATDPIAHRVAKMLKKEPWRTEVLKIAARPDRKPEAIPEMCPRCGSTVYIGSGTTREDVGRCCRGSTGEMNCPYEVRP